MKNNSFSWAKVSKVLVYLFFFVYLSGKAFYEYWIFDILAQYSLYSLLLTLIFSALQIFIVRKETKKSLTFPLIFLFAAYQFYVHVQPFYFSENSKGEVANLKIASVNIYSQNHQVEELKSFVQKENADVLLMLELTPKWQQSISFMREKYPYYKEEIRANNFGIGLYSKIPLKKVEVKNYIDENFPSLLATLEIQGKEVTILGTHPVPPIPNNARFKKRNEQFALMKKEIDALDSDRIIFLGDFNCTIFSPNFDKLKSDKLKDARQGFGIQNSWNAYIPFFRTNIDQLWVSKQIKVTNFYRGQNVDSDHFPIVAELKIN